MAGALSYIVYHTRTIPEQISPGLLYCRTNSLFQDSKYAHCTSLLWCYCFLERLRVKIRYNLLGWQYSYIGHLRSPQLMQRKFQICCSVTNWRESHCAEILHSEPWTCVKDLEPITHNPDHPKPHEIWEVVKPLYVYIYMCIYIYVYIYMYNYVYFLYLSVAAVAPKAQAALDKDQTLSLQVQPQNHRSRLMDQDIGDYSNSNAKTSEDMIDRHSEKLYEYWHIDSYWFYEYDMIGKTPRHIHRINMNQYCKYEWWDDPFFQWCPSGETVCESIRTSQKNMNLAQQMAYQWVDRMHFRQVPGWLMLRTTLAGPGTQH